MIHSLITVAIFPDSVNDVHKSSIPVNEIYIKEESVDDAVASTSGEQHMVIKREGSIDIKYEPLTSEDENYSLNMVSLHISKWSCASVEYCNWFENKMAKQKKMFVFALLTS
jgi:hypothetical protein